MIILKFGGTSVEDAAALDRACLIVGERVSRKPLVVVSALGGATNGLLEAGSLAARGEIGMAMAIADRLEHRHSELLPSTAGHFVRLRELLKALSAIGEFSPRTQDLIASYGEVLSSLIFTDRVKRLGLDAVHIDARQCMITNDHFGKASPLMDLTTARLEEIARPGLNSGRVVVMGGYIGSTRSGITTTLGRGGSDYSAAIAGAALNAEEIQIWTDVAGMMTADPRIVPNAWKVKEISFDEASELAYFGAKVLHPLTVLPAVEQNIPVYILNSRKPEGTGTRITREARPCRNLIKSIACKPGITILTVSSSRMLMAHGFLKALFEVFDRHRTPVDMVATSEVSVSLTLDSASSLHTIIEDLKPLGDVEVATNMALICLVGNNLKYTPGVARRAFCSIADINILMVSHGASNINFSFIVDEKDADSAIQKLHADFFHDIDREVFEEPA
ncbi:MAG: lysine-sensitive aspartokinase 3 [Acidobacteria bacterium]|nr:MAG: lysine-sensitive aspartokinase 3 [Acidobacteriota bacterium]